MWTRTLMMAVFLASASDIMAIGWQCTNQWGGTYQFNGNLNTVEYHGPLNTSDVLLGLRKSAEGTIANVVPFASWDMEFPTLGYTYSCQNSTWNRASCQELAGKTLNLELYPCVGHL